MFAKSTPKIPQIPDNLVNQAKKIVMLEESPY